MKDLLLRLRLVDFKESLSAFYPSMVRMVGAGLQFLNTIIIARKFGDEGSANFFFWSSIIMTSTPMASFGLEQLALRDVPRLQSKGVSSVKSYLAAVRVITLSLAIVFGLGLFIYAGISDGWSAWQILIPIGLASMTTIMVNGEVLKGLSHPNQGMIFGHLIPVILFTLCVSLFVSNPSFKADNSIGLLLIWFGCFLTATLFVRLSGQPELQGSPFIKPKRDIFFTLIKEGRSVFLGGIFGALSFMIPLAILKEFRGGPEVSYVTTALRLSLLISILAGAIHSVFAPKISRAAETFEARQLFLAYGKAIIFSLVALGPPIIVGLIFPAQIMSIFGDSFTEGANTLRILLAANLITLFMGPVLQLLVMIGSNRLLPRFGAIKLTLAALCAWLIVPTYGAVGVVLAMTGAFLLEEFLVLLYIIFKVRKSPRSQ